MTWLWLLPVPAVPLWFGTGVVVVGLLERLDRASGPARSPDDVVGLAFCVLAWPLYVVGNLPVLVNALSGKDGRP